MIIALIGFESAELVVSNSSLVSVPICVFSSPLPFCSSKKSRLRGSRIMELVLGDLS